MVDDGVGEQALAHLFDVTFDLVFVGAVDEQVEGSDGMGGLDVGES